MNVEIVGRHFELTPAIREFTTSRLEKLERLLGESMDAHVVLAIEKHRHIAEMKVQIPHAVFSGQVESGDLYTSLREVTDKIERQLIRHKEKVSDHRRAEKFGPAVQKLDEEAHGAA